MDAKRDVLDIWKERISKETQRGDKTRACGKVGVTLTTFQSAMRRATLFDLKDGELKVLQALIERLDARLQSIEQIQSKYAKQDN